MASAWDDDSGGWWREARREARKLRARFPTAVPVLADALLTWAVQNAGLTVRLRPPADALLCGAHAVLDHEAETIWLRNNAAPWERRLFIAHELGHFFLHGGATGDLWQTGCFTDADEFSALADSLVMVGYGPAQRRETEANVWAREFLLPAPTAQNWFTEDGLTARDIAARAGLPLSIAYAQLAAGLTDDSSLNVPTMEAAEEAAPPSPAAPPPPLTLDDTQAEAARKPIGPTLTHAGPGTGKTRTLTARALFLVNEQGVRPENILVLTFARKAAGELRERIALYAPNAARRIFISTFHAYGYDLLRRFAQEAGLPLRPLLLEKADLHALMERHLSDCDLQALRYLHDPAFPLGDLLQIINHAKESGTSPDDFAIQAKQSGDPKHEEAARVYACYQSALREHGAMDYSDLVHRAVRLLSENPDVREAERTQWRHVLVDEYQDVNRGGARLLQALTGDGAGLWAVGDVRQAIYQFRGASPANVARFAHDFPGGAHGDLGVNYRSVPSLVSLLGTVAGGDTKTWKAARDTDAQSPIAAIAPNALLAVAGDERAQWDGIAKKMREQRENGTRWDDIAVLCRTNQQSREAQAHLANRGIPVANVAGGDGPAALADAPGGLLSHPDAKNLLALLSRACEPAGSARHRFPEIEDTVLEKIGGTHTAVGDAYDFFADALWGRLGWARHIAHEGVVAALLGLARSFRDRAALITGAAQTETGATRGAFLDHLRRMALVGSPALQLPSAPRQNAPNDTETAMEAGVLDTGVRVMTVHAAKGLEFPVVFVPNLSHGKFPSRAAPARIAPLPNAPDAQTETEPASDPPTDDESTISHEEARLFFVAVSRAQNTLVLTRAEKYNNRRAQASPLLAPLQSAQNAGLIAGEWWPEAAGSLALQSPSGDADEADSAGELAEFPPVTIEAWEMDLYLRCPRRYYFERVAGLASPESGIPYQAFKRIMDSALAAPTERGANALFDAAWDATPALSQHAYATLYRESARNLIARFYKPGAQTNAPNPLKPLTPFVVERRDGGIIVRAEQNAPETGTAGRASKPSGVTFRTYRKTPARSTAEPDLRHILLGEAAPNVSVRFLQTGDVLPLAKMTDKSKQQQLARADRALKGIRLRVFAPDPADSKECPACPYFFICP